jgi:hypothetical protein
MTAMAVNCESPTIISDSHPSSLIEYTYHFEPYFTAGTDTGVLDSTRQSHRFLVADRISYQEQRTYDEQIPHRFVGACNADRLLCD